MKHNITPYGFKPFKLEIIVETENELRDLWHRLVLDNETLCSAIEFEDSVPYYPEGNPTEYLFYKIDDIAFKSGLKNNYAYCYICDDEHTYNCRTNCPMKGEEDENN